MVITSCAIFWIGIVLAIHHTAASILQCLHVHAQVTTYQIHTVQHIEPPAQGSEEEGEDDDTEAVLRSFRIKTLSESPRHSMEVRSPVHVAPFGVVGLLAEGGRKAEHSQAQLRSLLCICCLK